MAKPDNLTEFYKQQFVEIYHLDTLDWRVALILFPTFGGFFGVLGYLNILSATTSEVLTLGFNSFRAFSVFLAFLAFYGMWSVSRNHVWLNIRTKIIDKIELEMEVSAIWNSVVKKTRLSILTSRGIPLFAVYSLLLYFSLTVVSVDSIINWKTISCFGILATAILVLVCISIHWVYLKRMLTK
jgi:hypothetical protein